MIDTDRDIGRTVLSISLLIFSYYTIWILGVPFIDDSRLRPLFYSQEIALLVPAIVGLCFVGGLIVLTYYFLSFVK